MVNHYDCVYLWESKVNPDWIYVGQTGDFNVRTDAHLSDSVTDFDRLFVNLDDWVFRILVEGVSDSFKLDNEESYYIAAFDSIVNGLNVKRGNGLNVNSTYALKENRIGYLRPELSLQSNGSFVPRKSVMKPLKLKDMYSLVLDLPVHPICLNFKNGKKALFGFVDGRWRRLVRPIDMINLLRSVNPDLAVLQFPSNIVERLMSNFIPEDNNVFLDKLKVKEDSLYFDTFLDVLNTSICLAERREDSIDLGDPVSIDVFHAKTSALIDECILTNNSSVGFNDHKLPNKANIPDFLIHFFSRRFV